MINLYENFNEAFCVNLDEASYSNNKKRDPEEYNKLFFQRNGFDENGNGYVVLGDSYSVKDQLKSEGAKFNNFLKSWILPVDTPQYQTLPVTADQIFYKDQAEFFRWDMPVVDIENLQKQIKDINHTIARSNNKSEFQGTVGQKIKVDVVRAEHKVFQSVFGMSIIYKFFDADDNIYTWITTKDFEETNVRLLTGTVKAHEEFRGESQTILTRCKVYGEDGRSLLESLDEESEVSFDFLNDQYSRLTDIANDLQNNGYDILEMNAAYFVVENDTEQQFKIELDRTSGTFTIKRIKNISECLTEDLEDRNFLDTVAREFYYKCRENHVYLDECYGEIQVPDKAGFIYYIIEGDWKHDHGRADFLFQEYCSENDLTCFNRQIDEVGESDSDYYAAQHRWSVIKDI